VPVRILHLHGSFQRGGKEARVTRLMNGWGERAVHEVVVAHAGDDAARIAISPRVEAHFPDIGPALLQGKPAPGRYRRIARHMQAFDLVLTYNWGSMDAVMAHRLLSPFMKLPPLIHHEDGFNADEAERLKTKRNLFRRFGLGSAHALVVPSRRLEHIALTAWAQPHRQVHVIANGIDLDRFRVAPVPDAIPGFVRSPGKLVVGTLAGLRPVKNLRRLVRAVAPHKDRLQLVIVGEGEEREAIVAEAAALGIEDLCMPGHLSDPAAFVGLFDIFALSSDSEQFPISLVEAMAAGLPVVSTEVGDVASMVALENRPLIVPVADEAAFAAALGRLAGSDVLRRSLGEANRQVASANYGVATMVERYSTLYDEAMARGPLLR